MLTPSHQQWDFLRFIAGRDRVAGARRALLKVLTLEVGRRRGTRRAKSGRIAG